MLIVLESRNFALLDKGMEQLKKDFIESNPDCTISEDSDLSKWMGKKIPALVVLKEPYRLVDCMCSSKENREFVYQVYDYLHQVNHHLAISLVRYQIINQRLRIITSHRVSLHRTSFRIISTTDGRFKRGILGKDNLWEIITAPPETLPEDNLEPDEDIDNKVLVTIESKEGREDYMVPPEKPFTTKDGRVLTIVLPDNPEILT